MYAINKQDGYIIGIVSGVSEKNSNATESAYMTVKAMLGNTPTAPTGYGYRLREDLQWELYELPPVVEDPNRELSAEEALDIILGGNV